MTNTEKKKPGIPGNLSFEKIPAGIIKEALCGHHGPLNSEGLSDRYHSAVESHLSLVQCTADVECIKNDIYPLHQYIMFLQRLMILLEEQAIMEER